VCVGDAQGVEQPGLSLHCGRLDTLYALLAAKAGLSGLSVQPHNLDPTELKEMDRAIVFRRPGFLEWLILQINAGPAAVLYNCGVPYIDESLPSHRATMPLERPVAVFRDCEFIEESFLHLLLRGQGCSGFPISLLWTRGSPHLGIYRGETIGKEFQEMVQAQLKQMRVPNGPYIRPVQGF